MKTTLVAVSGMSPAIITETVWALYRESPAVIPDDVVIITTGKGEADIQSQLLSPRSDWDDRKSPWECLRAFILSDDKSDRNKLQLSIRTIELPDPETGVRSVAQDIRSHQDNDETADQIVRTIAPFTDTEDSRIIASIAGGRKTMSALLYAAMSLLGRETDRATHVLVSEPFETCRDFFFPDQPAREINARDSEGRTIPVRAEEAVIELVDIPFVPLRNRFRELNEPRLTFAGLVERYSCEAVPELSGPPNVDLDIEAGRLFVNGRPVPVGGRDLIVAAFLWERAGQVSPTFPIAKMPYPLSMSF